MSKSIEDYVRSKTQQREADNNFRSLTLAGGLVDFYSNDYLGLAKDPELRQMIDAEYVGMEKSGSTGSRLLSGNSAYVENLETFLAQFYQSEAALLFNSGFDANYGLLSALPYRGDTIIFDELVHASFHDGMRAGKAASVSFGHNNISELEQKLKAATGLKYVVVESVYSMDGDFAPLKEISELCTKYDAGLIVDEAHAGGIFGSGGRARAVELNLEKACLLRIVTFGKAIGSHGAIILCNNYLKQFLINYCRPFIYSTALPYHSLAAIKSAHNVLPRKQKEREKVFKLISVFKQNFHSCGERYLITSNSPVQSILISGNEQVKGLAAYLQQSGFDVRAILYPTVPKGKERIRICLHSFNSEGEVIKLAGLINSFETKTARTFIY